MKISQDKVAVGLSGGVDSTVAAYLLKKQGYEVIGITMHLFNELDEKGKIKEPQFIKDAKNIAKLLGIPHYVLDLRQEFETTVKNEFINEYLNGRTPNPCITCNKKIKYGKLLEAANDLGAYYIATGHFANITYDKELKRYRIFTGKANRKDQSYVLYSLTQNQLKHVILPLGLFKSKIEVREIASKIDERISSKSDSMGVCFIPDGDYGKYISKEKPQLVKKGKFVDINGNIIGEHKGIVNYTIGQRRGLGEYFNKPMFVIEIDAKKNVVVLGDDEDTYSKGLIGKDANFTLFDELNGEIQAGVKVCQWGWLLPATIIGLGNGKIKVSFHKKERAIAPGQSVVLFKGNEIIGGAKIESVIKN
ncbi:tRNA 2-thiouridine(34) synthase MnmA [Proteiniborus sp.]|uniref:tRNA 2-thiouridine(34) synthase MnmA n=1 Tax=Proteiniborus sp. TaxID=2079015 RepID=UPI00331B5466